MPKKIRAVIKSVFPGSIAEELDLRAGDIILEINGQTMKDIIDYRFLVSDDILEILVERDGEQWILDIEKDPDEGLGIDFTEDLFDGLHKCTNRCIFCFVDQTPKCMRRQIYIKDDDYRLSFLYGNFITLNNIKEDDLKRIVNLRLSPLYISVHTMNHDIRKLIFGVKKKDNIDEKLRLLVEGHIELHTQVVLCHGINDGSDLNETIEKLSLLYPGVKSLAVVPSGLTRYRDNLYPLVPYNSKSAATVIEQVEYWQKYFRDTIDTNFVFLADEFYIITGKPFPSDEHYEGYPQLENGVGMAVNFLSPLDTCHEFSKISDKKFTLVSGEASGRILSFIENKLPVKIVYCKNNFWGDSVTVTGLLTGQDIYKSLKDIDTGDEILIPGNAVRYDGLFLDDMSVDNLSDMLGKPVRIIRGDILELLNAMGCE